MSIFKIIGEDLGYGPNKISACNKSGHRLGPWQQLNKDTQCRKCTECGFIAVTAKIPSPK